MVLMDFLIRVMFALLLGAAIGFERQWRQKSAGLRTNTLVSLGSAAFTIISFFVTSPENDIQKGDVTRIISQIVTGVGFLGAGVIIREGLSVQGLNTAATIWCSAAVGSLSGLGLYLEAAIVAFIVILIHISLRPLGLIISRDNYKKKQSGPIDYLIKIKCRSEVENHIRVLLMQQLSTEDRVLLQSLRSDDNDNSEYVIITADVKASTQQDSLIEKIAARLTIEEKVSSVSWKIVGLAAED